MLASLAGCGADYSPNTYDSSAVQRANKVDQGVIVGRRQVDVSPSGATGAVAGAAAGGIAGSQAGTGVTQAFGALGGGLLGGVMGEAVEKTAGQTHAYEYVVREGNKDLVSVTQQDVKPLEIGTKVLVINGTQARIVPDYTVAIDPAPPADNTTPTAKPPPPVAQTPLLPPGALTPDPAVPATTGTPVATAAPTIPAPVTAATPAAAAATAAATSAATAETQGAPTVPVPLIKPGTEMSPTALLPAPAQLAPVR